MKPKFFKTPDDFRGWLEKNHDKRKELVVGYYKVATGKPSITWPESVKQALCFGWIDGIRRKIDEESYCIRFTPRRPGSNWSEVNIAYVSELKKKGLMKPEGLAAFEKRKLSKRASSSHPNKDLKLTAEFIAEFRKNRKAWQFYRDQPPHFRKTVQRWVMSAKKEETRARRLAKLIDGCERGERL